MAKIKLIKSDGTVIKYSGSYDAEKGVIFSGTKRIYPGRDDTVEVGPCFVATAVYGDANAPQVQVLRTWRDSEILPTRWGKGFVYFYYWIGPYGAWAIRHFPILGRPTRWLLDRIANGIERRS